MVPKKSKKIAHRIIKGEAFALDPSSQTLHSMNITGSRIWELIDGRRSAGKISGIICGEFEVDEAGAESDVEKFLAELSAQGLIEDNR